MIIERSAKDVPINGQITPLVSILYLNCLKAAKVMGHYSDIEIIEAHP